MKTVTLSKEQEIRLGPYRYAASLFPEIAYLLSDRDADETARKADGGCRIAEAGLRSYHGESLEGKSLLYAVPGDYREALLDLQAIQSLKRKYPSAVIDAATTIDTYLLFQQFSFPGAWQAYPVLRESAERYDYLFSSDVARDPWFPSEKAALKRLQDLIGADLDRAPLPLALNPAVKRTMAFGDSPRPLALLHLEGSGGLGDYPASRWRDLIRLLAEKDVEVLVSGYDGDPSGLSPLPAESVLGKDHSALEILAALAQADLIIASDSFAARAGGLLGKETLVLLGTEGRESYAVYPSVSGVTSAAPCAPCFRKDRCPLGHERCEAFFHESTAPERILEKALLMLEKKRGR